MNFNLTNIDTRQGTDSVYRFSNGNTLALTGVPFAMNYWTVQNNGADGGWFFNPNSHLFQGFRLTHQPSPWIGDYQHLEILPFTLHNNPDFFEDMTGSFEPDEATFNPHQLKIFDRNHYIKSALVPTTYGAKIKFEQIRNKNVGIQINLPKKSDLVLSTDGKQLTGYISNFADSRDPEFKMYLAITFKDSVDVGNIEVYNNQNQVVKLKGPNFTGEDLFLRLPFTTTDSELAIATSFISVEQAVANLKPLISTSFNGLVKDSAQKWHHYLDRIEITDHHQSRVKTFYTMLYREFLFPMKFFELDNQNQPIHYDTTSKTVKSGFMYTNNGFWDTYKTVYPFFSIIAPEILPEMLAGFLNSYRETGFLPKWLSPDERGMMPGTLIDAVIADAISKDIGLEMAEELLEAMIKSATVQAEDPRYGRTGTYDYIKYGYVPDSHGESVNHTQDYAYSDYCISIVAEKLGKTDIAKKYRKNALNYQNLFNKKSGFLETKNTAGEFTDTNFSPTKWGFGYTEGAAWQNSFAIYQDIAGYKKLLGGDEKFYEKLTELVNTDPSFEIGSYGFEIHEMTEMIDLNFGQLAMSNQPSFHIPYLFSYAKHPEMTQLTVKQLLLNCFNSGYQGFPGDEDNGSMAGWYLLSSLGIYPVTPGSTEFVIGIPLFDQVKLHLPNNKSLVINTENNYDHNLFVTKTELNKQAITKTYLTYDQIMDGGQLDYRLGLAPNPVKPNDSDLPYSISAE